jgi:signal transduction histidine kinase
VEDNGNGIPHKDLDRIFERFYVVDKGRSREKGGTGLGLSIVKHVAEAHGGFVHAESIPNKRTVFSISLPRISKI